MAENLSARTQFEQLVAATPKLWRYIDFRVCAVNIRGDWHNLVTQCYLTGDEPSVPARMGVLRESTTICGWRVRYPIRHLGVLLDGIAAGRLTTPIGLVHYVQIANANGAHLPYGGASFHRHDLGVPRAHPDFRWSGGVWYCMGDNVGSLLNMVEGSFNALHVGVRQITPPYDSVDSFVSDLSGVTWSAGSGRSASVEFVAPYEAKLNLKKCRLVAGQLDYGIVAGSLSATAAVRLSIFDPTEQAAAVEIPIGDWQRSGANYLTEQTVQPFRQESRLQSVRLRLTLHRETVQVLSLTDDYASDASLGLSAYRAIDPGLEALKLALSGKASSTAFTSAVARLVSLAGFYVFPIEGDKHPRDSIDVLASMATRGICLAIECTTSAITSNGKLAKLIRRARELQDSISSRGTVYPVMATSAPRSHVAPSELRQAREESVILLTQTELMQLAVLVDGGATPSHALDYLLDQPFG